MLSVEGNENGEKATISLIRKKATLHVQHICFVYIFLHENNVKLPEASCMVTNFMEEISQVAHFHPGRCKHFSFSHRRYKISCCSSNKNCLLCFFSLALALFLVELRWPVALLSLFLCFFFLYTPNLWTSDN